MRVLILGGTWFLGRTLVEQALARGWRVTTFSRGRDGRDAAGAEPVRGDRHSDRDVARLAAAGPWDAVVDTSGHVPSMVDRSARALADAADRYVYVSTVNVYMGWPTEPLTDDSPVYDTDAVSDTPGADRGLAPAAAYGALKAACERVAVAAFADRCLVLRPGVLLGPYEYVGRLPWLLRRMAAGGRVLAAGDPGRPIQPLDVRDLAVFALDSIETGRAGTMNVTAPVGHSTYGTLLETCRQVTGRRAELVWVDGDWLAGQPVTPWTEIPLWRTAVGAWQVRSDRAWSAGLACRPLADTVADTWAWMNTEPPMRHERADEIGLDAGKERQLLAAWHEQLRQAGR